MKKCIPIIFGFVIFSLAIYNIITQKCAFFEVNMGTLLTASVAIVLSYYLSQQRNDERKQQDVIDSIIIELKNNVQDDYLYIINKNTDNSLLLSKIRVILNDIEFLKNLKTTNISPEDIEYISNEFEKYNDLIGNHIQDIDYLAKSEKDLKKNLDSINSKLNKIRLDLYHLGMQAK